jgi:assimilatory nitrate reductase electron transfer subunit
VSAKHIVVIGNGMVGARFAEEVRGHDPAGRRFALTVLGAEHRPAYNRVLLPNLLSGTMQDGDLIQNDPAWYAAHHIRLRTGTAAIRISPRDQAVATSDGDTVGYDYLVLATGARARVPPIPGIGEPGELARGVTALRTMADAHRLTALATIARRKHGRVAVLGGGVLGLEAARALAARGIAVTVVHPVGHLMERQLDPAAGRILAAALPAIGVDVRLGVQAVSWEPGRGLWLKPAGADAASAAPELLACTGLLLSTGAGPDTSLAGAAGIRLTPHGAVAIDDALTTSDRLVFAIGDCAGHPGAAGGLVQPGWEQAAVLARRLTGADPRARYRGSVSVTRLKATGVDLTCAGDPFPEPADPDYEVLRFEAGGRYAKLVLQDDRVSGAIMLGFPDAAAGIVQLYDRSAPAPADRLALLFGRALPEGAGPGGSPATLADHAIVCRCNMVTKAQLRDAWYEGATSRAALCSATRAATGCGGCGGDIDDFTDWLASADPVTSPVHAPPAGQLPAVPVQVPATAQKEAIFP